MSNKIKKLQNYILRKFSYISRIPTDEKVVYLTFDDGPEPGIEEFVLDELNKYGFKATFFCRGDNAETYPELLERLRKERHTIGNHTYSHIHAYDVESGWYADDVERADDILHTQWLRPPHGSLTLGAWLKLHRKYKIVFWSLNSNDFARDGFVLEESIQTLMNNTRPGDIVLFHFCHKHEKETKKILPLYLEWLNKKGFLSKGM